MANARSLKAILNMGPRDSVVADYAQSAAGPGWANTPFWVIIYDANTGKLRQEALQPDETPDGIKAIYAISETVHNTLLSTLRAAGLRVRT